MIYIVRVERLTLLRWQFSPNFLDFLQSQSKLKKNILLEIKKLIVKYIWKCEGHILAKTICDKNNVGEFLILDFKVYFIPTLFRKVL